MQGLCLGKKVLLHARLDGNVCRSRQVIGNLANMLLVGVVVPDGFEGAIVCAANHRVGAEFVGIVPGVELFAGHIGRIEAGSGKAVGVSIDEGFPVDTVPRTVVDGHIFFLLGVIDSLQQGVLVAEILFPVDGVHLVGSETVEVQHFLSVVGNAAKVWSRNGNDGIIRHFPGEWRFG